jgi:hypothetical protein
LAVQLGRKSLIRQRITIKVLNWTYRHGPLSNLWERQEVETKNGQSLMNGEETENKAAGFDSRAMSRAEMIID